jgi:signal transduction histidine kinase/DNA-binding response OmpR family regulator
MESSRPSLRALPLRVLIVDDDPATRALQRKNLTRVGYVVVDASTLEEAEDTLRAGGVDVMVLDYRLDGPVSGLEFYRSMREAGFDLPAILVTGFSDESRAVEALRAGIRDVLPKVDDYLDYLPDAVGRVVMQVRTEREAAESVALRELIERLQAETQTLETIGRVGRRLAAELDLDKLIQTVTDACTEVIGAKVGAFGQTFRGEDVIRIDDVTKDPRVDLHGPHYGLPPGELSVCSYLAVPVLSRSGDTLGGLFFGHPDPAVFTARHARIVESIATQAAVAIDNARLVEAMRKNAEERERLLASERAARGESERASRLKDDFLATLSHELRTPLNAILGWAQLLRSRPSDMKQIGDGLETIERNARAQAQIVDDLLEMSRIISGKLRLEVQPVDLASTVESSIRTVRPAADAKSIRLQPILDPRAGPISGDPARIEQILWNLLSNAIKFTPKYGQVQVVLARVNSHVELTVSDTGIGIQPDFLPFLFDRFRQADASTTRQHRGIGLGLSIVKSLVEMHGGTVSASSEGSGHGATFVVKLPLTIVRSDVETQVARLHPTSTRFAPAADQVPRLTGLRILVVDDEPDARELLKRILSDYEGTVEVAASAAEALNAIAKQPPDVLVSDIGMPDVDGYELLRAVRRLPRERGGQTPAVALTAFARSEDRQRALLSGYQSHIAKPVQAAELITVIASVAGRLRSASS